MSGSTQPRFPRTSIEVEFRRPDGPTPTQETTGIFVPELLRLLSFALGAYIGGYAIAKSTDIPREEQPFIGRMIPPALIFLFLGKAAWLTVRFLRAEPAPAPEPQLPPEIYAYPILRTLETVGSQVGLNLLNATLESHTDPDYEKALEELDERLPTGDALLSPISHQVFRYPLKITYQPEGSRENASSTVDLISIYQWITTHGTLALATGETLPCHTLRTIEFDHDMLLQIREALDASPTAQPQTVVVTIRDLIHRGGRMRVPEAPGVD